MEERRGKGRTGREGKKGRGWKGKERKTTGGQGKGEVDRKGIVVGRCPVAKISAGPHDSQILGLTWTTKPFIRN